MLKFTNYALALLLWVTLFGSAVLAILSTALAGQKPPERSGGSPQTQVATIDELKKMPASRRGRFIIAEIRVHFDVIDSIILIPTYESFSYRIYDPRSIDDTITRMNDVLNLRMVSISNS